MSRENFEAVYPHTCGFEGGIAMVPEDVGGLTWGGISYASWPNWPGFPAILEAINEVNGGIQWNTSDIRNNHLTRKCNAILASKPGLFQEKKNFYYEHFWLVVKADKMPDQLARKVFDAEVNGGGVVVLQSALNVVLTPKKISVDGVVGERETLPAIQEAVARIGEQALITEVCNQHRARYLWILAKKPNQEKFRAGWMNRAAYRGEV